MILFREDYPRVKFSQMQTLQQKETQTKLRMKTDFFFTSSVSLSSALTRKF